MLADAGMPEEAGARHELVQAGGVHESPADRRFPSADPDLDHAVRADGSGGVGDGSLVAGQAFDQGDAVARSWADSRDSRTRHRASRW